MLSTNEQLPNNNYNDRMTLHENPLYKPPPIAQATLLSNNNYINNNSIPQTSTFSLPLTNQSVSPLTPRTPPTATIVGQRLPPPYVAAI